MHCIKDRGRAGTGSKTVKSLAQARRGAALLAATLLLGSCAWVAPPAPPAPPVSPSIPPAPSTAEPAAPPPAVPAAPAAPGEPGTPGPAPGSAPRVVKLPPPRSARSWDEFRLQAAQRLVQALPDSTFLGPVPEPLLAIPVLEVELNADGSVRRVMVLRHPSQARDTTQMAIDAVHRAAPYGAMYGLSRPWKWTEVFLFDEQRRFKPRVLDAD